MKKIILLLVLSLALCGVASAETSNDLKRIYGIGSDVDTSVIKQEISEAEGQIKSTAQTIFYNSVVASVDQNKVEVDISILMEEKNELEEVMSKSIDKSIEDILSIERKYDTLISEIDRKLKYVDSYQGVSELPNPAMDLSEISSYIKEREEQITTLTTFIDLGVVTNVKHPLDNRYYVNSAFGNRVDPLGFRGTHFHTGLDLRATSDTKVLSQFNGTISQTGWSDAVGNYIRIDHGDGVETYYCHLNKVLVEVGQTVKQYANIALSGGTGTMSTGPHLHFNLYLDSNLVDPAILLEQGGKKAQ